MPAEPFELWKSEPFQPEIRDGKIWARGADDDKGQSFMHIKALEYMVSTNTLPCNVKFMIEGEEEVGSEHLGLFVASNKEKLKADVKSLKERESSFSKDVLTMKDSERGTKEKSLSQLRVDVQRIERELREDINIRRNEELGGLQEQINKAVTSVSKEEGFDLVSSNKIANTISLKFYKELRSVLAKFQKNYLYETNVGAGLPLIDTIQLLHLSGENITRIRGVFSGSLGYLFNNFSAKDVPFSEILKEAIDNGYTEPDPREDLCGNDVGRKLLILARELDLQNEFEEIKKAANYSDLSLIEKEIIP
mgnify:CR=1 FL=1